MHSLSEKIKQRDIKSDRWDDLDSIICSWLEEKGKELIQWQWKLNKNQNEKSLMEILGLTDFPNEENKFDAQDDRCYYCQKQGYPKCPHSTSKPKEPINPSDKSKLETPQEKQPFCSYGNCKHFGEYDKSCFCRCHEPKEKPDHFYCFRCKTEDSTKCSHWEMNSTIAPEKPECEHDWRLVSIDSSLHDKTAYSYCCKKCNEYKIKTEKPKEKTMEWCKCPKPTRVETDPSCGWRFCAYCGIQKPKQKELRETLAEKLEEYFIRGQRPGSDSVDTEFLFEIGPCKLADIALQTIAEWEGKKDGNV